MPTRLETLTIASFKMDEIREVEVLTVSFSKRSLHVVNSRKHDTLSEDRTHYELVNDLVGEAS